MPDTPTSISALILAGGKATRMGGAPKHQLVIDGHTIFDRQVAVLAPRVREIVVSSATEIAGYRTVRDAVADIGPLAGIAAGIAALGTAWVLVVAGDMPYLTGELIDRIIAETEDDMLYPAPNEGSFVMQLGAVGIMSKGLPEPLLCALHRMTMLDIIEDRIARRQYKASGLLTDSGVNVRWITDADPNALRNVNSPEDL